MARNIPLKALSIAAWHGWLARRGLAALFGVYTAQQLVLLFAAAALPANLGCGYAALFLRTGQVIFFLLGGVAALGLASAALWSGGRSEVGIGLRTLPGARWKLPAGQTLLCAAVAVGFVAWQLLLYFAFYPPVAAVSTWRLLASLETPLALPTGGLYEQLAQNPLLQVLLPTYPLGWAALAIDLAALAVGHRAPTDEVARNWAGDSAFAPALPPGERAARLRGWNKAVRCAYHWALDEA